MPEPAVANDPQPTPESNTPAPDQNTPAPDPDQNVPEFSYIPDGWRNDVASGDEKKLKQVSRLSSFGDFVNKFWEQEKRISEGAKPAALPENATEDQIKAYRESAGIPHELDAYRSSVQLGDGVVPGEAEQSYLDAVTETAHQLNLPPQAVSEIAKTWLRVSDEQHAAQQAADSRHSDETVKLMRDHWGPDAQVNFHIVDQVIKAFPKEVQPNLMNARLSDGRALFNSPEFLTFIVDQQRKANPAISILPGGDNPMASVEAEIAKIEKVMREDPDTYWKDQAMQDRLRELYSIQTPSNPQEG